MHPPAASLPPHVSATLPLIDACLSVVFFIFHFFFISFLLLQGLFSSVLELLAGQHQLPAEQAAAAATVLRCCVGCIYDSCPVDFTSEAVRRMSLSVLNFAVCVCSCAFNPG